MTRTRASCLTIAKGVFTMSMKAWLAAAAITFVASLEAQPPRPVDAAVLKAAGTANDPMAGSWLSYGRTQGETRYSPLNQINASNAGKLGLAWSYVVGAGGGNQEGTPLVWNNTIYGITNWSVVFALDARTGKQLWRWDPEVNQTTVRPKLCCGIVNRGLAISNGLIFAPVIDGRLTALDALTGEVKWEARLGYPQAWASITMAPRVAGEQGRDRVAGGDHPLQVFLTPTTSPRAIAHGASIRSRATPRRVSRTMRSAKPRKPGAASIGRAGEAALCGMASRTIPT